jgi:hypothetical protein
MKSYVTTKAKRVRWAVYYTHERPEMHKKNSVGKSEEAIG